MKLSNLKTCRKLYIKCLLLCLKIFYTKWIGCGKWRKLINASEWISWGWLFVEYGLPCAIINMWDFCFVMGSIWTWNNHIILLHCLYIVSIYYRILHKSKIFHYFVFLSWSSLLSKLVTRSRTLLQRSAFVLEVIETYSLYWLILIL